VLPLVSLTGALAIYLALELDRSWTEIAHLRGGQSSGRQSLTFWPSVPKIDLPFGQRVHCAGLCERPSPGRLSAGPFIIYVRSTRTRVGGARSRNAIRRQCL
jgi:hypothetical protein